VSFTDVASKPQFFRYAPISLFLAFEPFKNPVSFENGSAVIKM